MLPTPNKSDEFVIFIYLYFDEISQQIQERLLTKRGRGGSKSKLSIAEVLTLGCLFVLSGIPTRTYRYAEIVS